MATVPWRVFLSECPGETAASATSSFECTDANHDRTSSTTSSRSGEAGARTASAGVFAGVGCVSLFPGVHAAAALTMAAAATAFVTVGLNAPPVRVPSSKALSAPTRAWNAVGEEESVGDERETAAGAAASGAAAAGSSPPRRLACGGRRAPRRGWNPRPGS